MLERAAIKRATLAAHRSVEQLDADLAQALIDLYQDAADDLAVRIGLQAGADATLTLQELRSTLAQIEARLRGLSQARDELLGQALEQAADLGAQVFAGGVATAASMKVSHEALRFVQTFVAEDGLQLSDRIWRLDRGARDRVVNALEMAVIQGHGAAQAARELLSRGQPVPSDLRDKARAADAAGLGRQVDELMTGEGSPMVNALRLMRTEINRAHGEAYMMGGEDHPDFAGWRFLLSPAHPKPDICDLLSAQNLYGLGPGVYPDRESCPWPAHPNTLSFVEIVFKDEITGSDRAGKETPMQALARLTPEQREGVLGKGKAAIHDAGKLRQGMIRAPLKDVRERIGPVDDRDDLTRQYFSGASKVETGGAAVGIGQRTLSDENFVRLTGAPDGSTVRVSVTAEGITMAVENRALFDGGTADFEIIREPGGAALLLDHSIMLKREAQQQGLGLRMFAIQAFEAEKLGLDRIELEAAGSALSRVFSGYYVWPRFGFDAPLSAAETARLPEGLAEAATVQDLMATRAGRAWWKANGSGRPMAFDLTGTSRSWQTLIRVMTEKGVRL